MSTTNPSQPPGDRLALFYRLSQIFHQEGPKSLQTGLKLLVKVQTSLLSTDLFTTGRVHFSKVPK
jgi:hypothetical protein